MSMMKCIFRWLPAVALIAGAGLAQPASAQKVDTIRVGIQSVPPDEVYAAKDWGKPYGLDAKVTSFSSGGDMLQAFLAGRIDVANGGSARLVTMASQQPDSFYIIATHQHGGDRYSVIVAKDSPVTKVSELKGKKIGAVTGSGTFSTFRVYLEQNGMSEKDFQIVNMKVEDLRAAVQKGIIDAAVAWEPHVSIAETMGVAKRIQSLDGVNESPNFILVRRDFAKENPDAVTKFVASLIDVATLIRDNPEEAGKLAATEVSRAGVQVDPKALALSFTRIKMDRDVSQDLIAELVPIAKAMHDARKIRAIPEFDTLVNRSFYEAAVKLAQSKS